MAIFEAEVAREAAASFVDAAHDRVHGSVAGSASSRPSGLRLGNGPGPRRVCWFPAQELGDVGGQRCTAAGFEDNDRSVVGGDVQLVDGPPHARRTSTWPVETPRQSAAEAFGGHVHLVPGGLKALTASQQESRPEGRSCPCLRFVPVMGETWSWCSPTAAFGGQTRLVERTTEVGGRLDTAAQRSKKGAATLRNLNWRRDVHWNQVCAELDLAGLTLHDLRRLARLAGADLKYNQKAMGHSSITVTAEIYAHLFDSELDQVSDALDSLTEGVGDPVYVQMRPRGRILDRIGPRDRGRKPSLTCGDAVEPPIGIEPMTYSLRVNRSSRLS